MHTLQGNPQLRQPPYNIFLSDMERKYQLHQGLKRVQSLEGRGQVLHFLRDTPAARVYIRNQFCVNKYDACMASVFSPKVSFLRKKAI